MLLTIALALLTGPSDDLPKSGYRLEILPLGPMTWATAHAVNSAGMIGGRCTQPSRPIAPCFWLGGQPTLIPLVAGAKHGLVGQVTEDGLALVLFNGPVGEQAFTWFEGSLTKLQPLGGQRVSGSDVNAHGVVVGSSSVAPGTPPSRAALWRDPSQPIDLGTLGGSESNASAISDRGWIAGSSQLIGDVAWRAVIWKDGIATALPPLPQDSDSFAIDLNDRGLVVGQSRNSNLPAYQDSRAVVWIHGHPIAVELPDDTLESRFARINSAGQAIGCRSSALASSAIPFLWQEGQAVELADLAATPPGWDYYQAYGLSEDGRIVGSGVDGRGCARAWALTPMTSNLNRDAVVDAQDLALFATAYTSQNAAADWNGDGHIDAADRSAFASDWLAGR